MSDPSYQADLAYIHDRGFGAFATNMAPGLLALFEAAGLRGGREGGRVVDLGCGSGIWLERLIQHGYQVLGVDLSPAMIALARQRIPQAELHAESCWDFVLPRCSAITALGEVLCYRRDGAGESRSLRPLFEQAFSALEPGGLLIFDVAEIGLDRNRSPFGHSGDEWAIVTRFEYDSSHDHLLRHIETFRRVGDLYRRHRETHRVELYDRAVVAESLRDAGFEVEVVDRFGAARLLPGRVGFVARKPRAA